MKAACITGGLIFITLVLLSQQNDSLIHTGSQVIERQLEHLQDLSESGIDLSELSEGLIEILQHPMNINTARKAELKSLHFLNDIQVRNIVDYRNKYGDFLSVYELKHVDGIGSNSLRKLVPFITVAPSRQEKMSGKSMLYGQHEVLFRFQRKLLESAGYEHVNDSVRLAGPSSYYLGDPSRMYLRYRYKVSGKLSAAILAEKDPGEKLYAKPYGPDFLSFHVAYEGKTLVRRAIAGDFHARFGQGLVLWSGLSFQGGSDPASIKRYAAGISPNTSANEVTFLRGAAICLGWKKLLLTLLYSRKKVDANLVYDEGGSAAYVSSLLTSGYHRTPSELADRNSLQKSNAAVNLNFSGKWFRLGASASYNSFTSGIRKEPIPENIYSFSGKDNLVTGIDLDLILRRTNIFAEIARSRNGAWAAMGGITHLTENGSIFALSYRDYGKDFQNLDARAAGNRDHNANERAFRLMIEMPLSKGLSIQASCDHYAYPWITYGSENSHKGQDYRIRLIYARSMKEEYAIRYRFRQRTVNIDPLSQWFDIMAVDQKHEMHILARMSFSEHFSGKIQSGFVVNKNKHSEYRSKGSMLLFDLYCHPAGKNIRFTFRYALFNTDDYNSRLYAYEHDVLYASSMPAYYGKGFRLYVLLKYSPFSYLDTWFRFSLTNFTDRNIISSGADEIKGNKLPEIKIQLRLKL